MFTLNSLHITSLFFALATTFLIITAFAGLTKSKMSFMLLLVFFPYTLCLLSLFIPQSIIQYATYGFYIFGLFCWIYKIFTCHLKKNFVKYHNLYTRAPIVEKLIIIFIFVHMLSSMLDGTIIRGEGSIIDAMTYHLGSPKEWSLFTNGPHLNLNNPVTLTASYFEYIQYSVFLLFKPLYIYLAPLKETHHEFLSYTLLISAQLFTAIFGNILIPLLIFEIFKNKKYFAYVAILFVFGLKDLNWIWKTAKNDAFPLYCTLLAYLLLIRYFPKDKDTNKKNIIVFTSFTTLGIALGAKVTNIYALLPISVAVAVLNYKLLLAILKSKAELIQLIFIALIGGMAGILPYLARNYLETGNPFFPTDSSLFPNVYYSDNEVLIHHTYSMPTTWTHAIEKIIRLFRANPGIILLTFFSFLFRQWKIPILFFLMIIFISKMTGQKFAWRQISTLIFLFIIWGEVLFNKYITFQSKWRKHISYAIIILVIALSQFKPERLFKHPAKYWQQTIDETMEKSFYAWKNIISDNIQQRDSKKFISHIGSGYLSRFPFMCLNDTREEFRTYYEEYFANKNK